LEYLIYGGILKLPLTLSIDPIRCNSTKKIIIHFRLFSVRYFVPVCRQAGCY